MKKSTKIIFLGLLSSIALIITCIYFKYNMILDGVNSSVDKSFISDIQNTELNSIAETEPKLESFPQLVDIEKGESVVIPTQVSVEEESEPKALEVSSLDYNIEKGLIRIDGKMPILENNDTLKLMLMSRCEMVKCDKKILFSPKQVEPKWKKLATETIHLFNSEKMDKANLKVEGNRIYISGEFTDKLSKEKLDALVEPYLTIYSIENNTTIKKEAKKEEIKKEEAKVLSSKEETPKIDVQNSSIKIVEEKISDILKEKRVNFYKNSAKITKKGKKTLDEIIIILKKQKDIHIEVQGHTDASGRAKVNQWISAERAKSVKLYLKSKRLNAQNITAKGFGETKLLLKNRPNNAINRRVEIKIKRR